MRWLRLLNSDACACMHSREQVDDVVDAIPVHFACGAWGVIAASLFATKTNCKCCFIRLLVYSRFESRPKSNEPKKDVQMHPYKFQRLYTVEGSAFFFADGCLY